MSEYLETIIKLLQGICTLNGMMFFCILGVVIDSVYSHHISLKGDKHV